MKIVMRAVRGVCVVLLALLVITLFTGVILRYFFHTGVPEFEVIRKFCIVWMTMLGAVIALAENTHLQVDLFPGGLKGKLQYIRLAFIKIVTLIAIAILLWIGYAAIEAGSARTELTQFRLYSGKLNLLYYYSAVFVGALGMLYVLIMQARDGFKKSSSDDESDGDQ